MTSGPVEQVMQDPALRATAAVGPAGGAAGDLAAATPDDLLRRARAIRRLLDDTDPDDHAMRIRLVAALDVVRLHAAQQWHARGWRPITDAEVVPRPTPSFLLAPAVAGVVASVVSSLALATAAWVASMLAVVCAAPLVAERLGRSTTSVRRLTRLGALTVWLYLAFDSTLTSMVLLPAALLLLTIGLVGTDAPGHDPSRSATARSDG